MAIEAQPQEQEKFARAKKLHEQLERSGAYEKITDQRDAQLLRAYLPTEITTEEARQVLDKPVTRVSVSRMLRRGMRQAFPYLDEQTRQEYGTPDAALRTLTGIKYTEGSRCDKLRA